MLDPTIRRLELSYDCPACGVRVDGAVGNDEDHWLACPACKTWHWTGGTLATHDERHLMLPRELWGCTLEWSCPECGTYNRNDLFRMREPEETEVSCAECNHARHLRLRITSQEPARTEVF